MLVNISAQLAAGVGSVAESLVVVANDSLRNEGGKVVGVAPAHTLDGEGDVGGGHGVVADTDLGTDEVGGLLGEEVRAVVVALGGEVGKVLLGHLDELLVGNAASASEDHAVGGVVVLDVVGKLGAGKVSDVLAGAEDGATQGLVLVCGGVEVIENNLLNLLLDLLRLAQNNIAFPLDGRLLELGVLKNILQDIDALGDVLVQGLGEIDGVLALAAVLVGRGWARSRGPDEPRYRR